MVKSTLTKVGGVLVTRVRDYILELEAIAAISFFYSVIVCLKEVPNLTIKSAISFQDDSPSFSLHLCIVKSIKQRKQSSEDDSFPL